MGTGGKKRKKRRKLVIHPRFFVVVGIFIVVLALFIALVLLVVSMFGGCNNGQTAEGEPGTVVVEGDEPGLFDWLKGATPTPTPTPTPAPTPSPTPKPTPYYVDSSNPDKFGIVQHIEANGMEVPEYRRADRITFGLGTEYASVPGVLTFRGDNYRNNAAYGTASIAGETPVLSKIAERLTTVINKGSGSNNWSGSGWTGQPLVVQWDAETRQIMNLYESAKSKENLVEVILPCEGGNVFFYDLETGEATRDPLYIAMPFKGTGAVDPRGYPLLYIGSGDMYENDSQKTRAMIYSLIDGSKLYEFGKQGEEPFAKRVWYAYDAAPLIDAQTDTLIYAAETGIVYTMQLNTVYDKTAGTISVNPSEVVKFRYDSSRSSIGIGDTDKYWLGYEGSPVAWNEFLYLSSNDGIFQCLDLNNMTLKWTCDTLDDTNGTPVLDVISDTEAYLYVGTSLHFTQDENKMGVAPFFKINAMTGEIVKRYDLTVYTQSGVSGGIQSSACLGRENLDGLVFVTVARYPGSNESVLVALDTETFDVKWKMALSGCCWSSPTAVYTDSGRGYILQADQKGNLYLLDGTTGTIVSELTKEYGNALTETNFEASPVVFGNYAVIGCRGGVGYQQEKVFFLKFS